MKIGPFTPPHVREAILWEQEHAHELPVVLLPDIYLSIAGFTIKIASHESLNWNPVDRQFLSAFIIPPVPSVDYLLFLRGVQDQFHVPQGSIGNVVGEFATDYWLIQTNHWRLQWKYSEPTIVECEFFLSSFECFSALRLFLAHQLLHQKLGFLLHASAAHYKNNTFIFLGCSGSGKSTSAYFSPGIILSDETVAIISLQEKIISLGTPFGGEHFPNSTIGNNPSFLFLEKSNRNSRKAIPARNAVAGLLSQIILFPYAPISFWDAAGEIVKRIIEESNVEILEVKKDGSFWKECLS